MQAILSANLPVLLIFLWLVNKRNAIYLWKIATAIRLLVISNNAFAGQRTCTPIGSMAMPTFSPRPDGTVRNTSTTLNAYSRIKKMRKPE